MSWISLGHLGSSRAPLSCSNILVCWHYLFIFICCRLNQHWSEGKACTWFSSLSSELLLNTSPSKNFSSTFIPSRMPLFPKETVTHCCKLHPPKGCIHQFSLLSTRSRTFSAFSTACWSSVGRKNKYESIKCYWLKNTESNSVAVVFLSWFFWFIPTLTFNLLHILSLDLPWNDHFLVLLVFFYCGQVSTKDHLPDLI